VDVGETLTVRSRDQWRRWLAKHHADKKEIWLIYFRKTSGKSGISYEESVEEALAYGWIDGQVKGVDDARYAGRFTPRRPGSNWSTSNVERIKRLIDEGRMAAPGLAIIPKELRP
jgi:uncharacterized protein YdeI (YjbR/CyaY-like superfamily)